MGSIEVVDPQEQVTVPWTPHDYDHARITTKLRPRTHAFKELPTTITRGQIVRFCEPCGNCNEAGKCETLSEHDQTRNAARQFCGKAIVYAEPMHITSMGPEPVRFDF